MEEWSYPLGFLAGLMIYFVVTGLADAPVGFWQWVEQLSWLAALASLLLSAATLIVAVWIGLPQLRKIRDEQRRLFEEQTRKPVLRVGLKSPDPYDLSTLTEITAAATWIPGYSHSGALALTVETLNLGTRSARDVFWEFIFDGIPAQAQVSNERGDQLYDVIQAESPDEAVPLRRAGDWNGWNRYVARAPYMHPMTAERFVFSVHAPKGDPEIRLLVVLSAADLELQEVRLKVNIANSAS